jgi:hypothetical protein
MHAPILSMDSTKHLKKREKTIIGAEGKKDQAIGNHSPYPNQPKKHDHLPQQFQRFHQQQALGLLHHHLLLALAVHQQFAASETVAQASLGSPSYLALENLSPRVPLAS